MPESLLYVIFKDTVSDDRETSLKLAVTNIRDQLIAAVERLQTDPEAIYSYLKQESTVKKPEPKTDAQPMPESPQAVIPLMGEEETLNLVLKNIRRTTKSVNIVRYLIQNAGMELGVEQLIEGASINKNDLSSWMATTGTRIPSITRPARGVYKFNPDKLNYN